MLKRRIQSQGVSPHMLSMNQNSTRQNSLQVNSISSFFPIVGNKEAGEQSTESSYPSLPQLSQLENRGHHFDLDSAEGLVTNFPNSTRNYNNNQYEEYMNNDDRVYIPRLQLEDMWSDATIYENSLENQEKRPSIDCSLLSHPNKQTADTTEFNCLDLFDETYDSHQYDKSLAEEDLLHPASHRIEKNLDIDSEGCKLPKSSTGRSVGCDTLDLSNTARLNTSLGLPSSARTTPGRISTGPTTMARSQSLGQVVETSSPRQLAEKLITSVRGRSESPVIIINHHTTCDHKCSCKGDNKEDGKPGKAVKSKRRGSKPKKSSKVVHCLLFLSILYGSKQKICISTFGKLNNPHMFPGVV